jgi:hypothetical protein
MAAIRRYCWRDSLCIIARSLISAGVIVVRLITVVFLAMRRFVVVVFANVNMRSRRVIRGLCYICSLMRMRQAQPLVGEQ